jgi:hypothetical protein
VSDNPCLPRYRLSSFAGGPCATRNTAQAMSQENVEVARDSYEAVNRWLDSYWANPGRPLNEVPGTDALFERLDPEAEWNWALRLKTSRGRDQ